MFGCVWQWSLPQCVSYLEHQTLEDYPNIRWKCIDFFNAALFCSAVLIGFEYCVCSRLFKSTACTIPCKPFGAGAASQQGDVTDDDDESLDLMEALEASLRSAEDALRQRQTQLRQQEQLNGCCVVCLGHMHGGVHCINPVQTAEGEGPAHFLCKECIPLFIESNLDRDDTKAIAVWQSAELRGTASNAHAVLRLWIAPSSKQKNE